MGLKKILNFKQPTIRKQLTIPKKEKQYGGIIQQLQLEDFWHHLEVHERSFIRNCMKWSFGGKFNGEDIDHPDSTAQTKRDDCRFLIGNAAWAFDSKEYVLAEKILNEVIRRSQSTHTLHRAYQKLINIYEVSKVEDTLIQKWKNYCEEHIKLAPALFYESYNKEELPTEIRSFCILKEILLAENAFEEYKEILMLEQEYNHGNYTNKEMYCKDT